MAAAQSSKSLHGGELTTLYDFCSQDGVPGRLGAGRGTGPRHRWNILRDIGWRPRLWRGLHLSMGLGPFVETNPAAAKVGKKVGILGTNLTGATNVTFNGVAAEFKVRSQTLIVAEVPSGATNGKVQVQLPSATLSSNVPFIVLK